MTQQHPSPRFNLPLALGLAGAALGALAIVSGPTFRLQFPGQAIDLGQGISPIGGLVQAQTPPQTIPQITSVSHDAPSNRNTDDVVLVTVRGTANSTTSS